MTTDVIMLTGTGGTGKTTCASFIKDTHSNCFVAPSYTREAYASFGVKSEIDTASMDLLTKLKLQQHVYDVYLSNVYLALYKNSKADLVLFERSPFDHVAYAEQTIKNCKPEFTKLFEEGMTSFNVVEMLEQANDLIADTSAKLFYFPYPAPWTNESSVDDGFRLVDSEKDSSVDHYIQSSLKASKVPFKTVYADSVANRSAFILNSGRKTLC
jgi:hypothetical protein